MLYTALKVAITAVLVVAISEAGKRSSALDALLASLPFIQSGRLRALGVCGSMRARALPNVPTVGDTLKGFESAGWYALLGPAGLPREVTNKLYEAFAAALKSPDMARRLGDQGADVIAGTPDDLARLLPREVARWAAVVKAAGSKAD